MQEEDDNIDLWGSMTDFMDALSAMALGPGRELAFTEVDGLAVSTVVTHDQGPETAIMDINGAHPVQRYDSETEALQGHAEWVERVPGLTKVTKLGYGVTIGEKEIELERQP